MSRWKLLSDSLKTLSESPNENALLIRLCAPAKKPFAVFKVHKNPFAQSVY